MKPKVINNLGTAKENDKFYFHISECLSEFSDKIKNKKNSTDNKAGGNNE